MSSRGHGRGPRPRTRRTAVPSFTTASDATAADTVVANNNIDAASSSKAAETSSASGEGTNPSPTAGPSIDDPSEAAGSSSQRGGTTSPDPHCAICLGALENKSFTDSCFHMFCFVCLQEWSKIKAECPLCKQPFKSIIHNVKSYDKFDQFVLEHNRPPPRPMYGWSFDPAAFDRRFRYRTTLTMDHHYISLQHSVPLQPTPAIDPSFQRPSYRLRPERSRSLRPVSTTEFRRHVYESGRRVMAMRTSQRRRTTSPSWFNANPAQTHRLVPWLNRELNALLFNVEHTVAFVLELTLDLIKRFPIDSEEFYEHIHPYLRRHTRHFMHEFLAFARSPFTMHVYDTKAVYGTPGIATSEGSSNDSDIVVVDDDDAEEAGRPGNNSRLVEPSSPRRQFEPGTSVYQMTGSYDAHMGRFTPAVDLVSSGWDSPTPGPSWDLGEVRGSFTEPVNVDDSGSSSDSTIIDPTFYEDNFSSLRRRASSSDDDEEAVIFVSYDKPWEERSPIKLSSSEDESTRFVLRLKKEHKKKKRRSVSSTAATGSSSDRHGRLKEGSQSSSPSGHRSRSSHKRSAGHQGHPPAASRKSRHPEKKSKKRHHQSSEGSSSNRRDSHSKSTHKKRRHHDKEGEGRSNSEGGSEVLTKKHRSKKNESKTKDVKGKDKEKGRKHRPHPYHNKPSATVTASSSKDSTSGSSSERFKKHPSGHKKSRAKETHETGCQESAKAPSSQGLEKDFISQVPENKSQSQKSEPASKSQWSENDSKKPEAVPKDTDKVSNSQGSERVSKSQENDCKGSETVQMDTDTVSNSQGSEKASKVQERICSTNTLTSPASEEASTSQASGDGFSSCRASGSGGLVAPKPSRKYNCWSREGLVAMEALDSSSGSDHDSYDSYSSYSSSSASSSAVPDASETMALSASAETSLRTRCERVAQVLNERHLRQMEAASVAPYLYPSWSMNSAEWRMNLLTDLILGGPPCPSTSATDPLVIESDDSDVETLSAPSAPRQSRNETVSESDLHVAETVVVPCSSTLGVPTPAIDIPPPSSSRSNPVTLDDDSDDLCVDVESISSDSASDSEVVDVESLELSTEDESVDEVIDVVESRPETSRHSVIEVSTDSDAHQTKSPSSALAAGISHAFAATHPPKPARPSSFSIQSILSKDVFMGSCQSSHPLSSSAFGTELSSSVQRIPRSDPDFTLLQSLETEMGGSVKSAARDITVKDRMLDQCQPSLCDDLGDVGVSELIVVAPKAEDVSSNEDRPLLLLDQYRLLPQPQASDGHAHTSSYRACSQFALPSLDSSKDKSLDTESLESICQNPERDQISFASPSSPASSVAASNTSFTPAGLSEAADKSSQQENRCRSVPSGVALEAQSQDEVPDLDSEGRPEGDGGNGCVDDTPDSDLADDILYDGDTETEHSYVADIKDDVNQGEQQRLIMCSSPRVDSSPPCHTSSPPCHNSSPPCNNSSPPFRHSSPPCLNSSQPCHNSQEEDLNQDCIPSPGINRSAQTQGNKFSIDEVIEELSKVDAETKDSTLGCW